MDIDSGFEIPNTESNPANPAETFSAHSSVSEASASPATVQASKGTSPSFPSFAERYRRTYLPTIMLFSINISLAFLYLYLHGEIFYTPATAATVPSFLSPSTTVIPATTPPNTITITGRDATRKQDLAIIKSYLTAYYAANGSYPIVPEGEKLNDPNAITVQALVPRYAAALPEDPLGSRLWYSYTSANGKAFELSAQLENSADPEATLIGSEYYYFLRN